MASNTWTGEANTYKWADGENWSGKKAPVDGDDITIPYLPAKPYPADAPSLTVGKFHLGYNIRGGKFTVAKELKWTAGVVSGGGITVNREVAGTVTATPGLDIGLAGEAVLSVEGSLTISGSSVLQLSEGASIINNGTLTITDGMSFVHVASVPPSLINNGTLVVQNGDSTSYLRGGSVELQLRGSLRLESGRLVIGSGATTRAFGVAIGGPGRLVVGDGLGGAGLLQVEGDSSVESDSTVELAPGGLVRGPHASSAPTPSLVIEGTLLCSGGDLNSPVTVTPGGRVTVVQGGKPTLVGGGVILNTGVVEVMPDTQLDMGWGGGIENRGRFLVGSGAVVTWKGGQNPFIDSTGQVAKTGDGIAKFTGIDIGLGGKLTLHAGRLVLGSDAKLRVAGASIAGPGRLVVGDGAGGVGVLRIEAKSTVEAGTTVEIAPGGLVQGPQAPVAPTPSLAVDGALRLGGGGVAAPVSVSSLGRVIVEGAIPTTISGALIENAGTVELTPDAQLEMGWGAEIRNTGRLTIGPRTSVGWRGGGNPFINNAGLVEKVGEERAAIYGVGISNVGSIVISKGELALFQGALLQQTDGVIALEGGDVGGESGIVLEGGSLRGHGTVAGSIRNSGWLEPAASGLVLGRDYEQTDSGNLIVSSGAWGAARPPLRVTGTAALAGTIWTLAQPNRPPVGVRADLLSAGNISGTFGHVRAPSDEQRLQLNYATTLVSGEISLYPGLYYGFDRSHFPENEPALNRTGESLMHQLYEDSQLCYVGFYLSPAPNHQAASWMPEATVLRDQGWGLLPIYFGRQQENPGNTPQLIDHDEETARQQGVRDANDAAGLAATAHLEDGITIFLDVETANPLQQHTLIYIGAWIEELTNLAYSPGVYCAPRAARLLHAFPDLHMGVVHWLPDNPIDENKDLRPVRFAVPIGANPVDYDWLDFAHSWQFRNWTGIWRLYLDTGRRQDWECGPGRDLDFNVSRLPDPSRPARPGPKFRRLVDNVTLEHATIAGGAKTHLYVNLQTPAPHPDGTVVIIGSSAPEVQVTRWLRVPPGASAVPVPLNSVPVAAKVTATLSARTLHQLEGGAKEADLSITPAS